VRPIPHRHHTAGKRKIGRGLDRPATAPAPQPVFTASKIHHIVAYTTCAIPCGGIDAMTDLVAQSSVMSRVLHQNLTEMAGTGPSPSTAS
jgi:hypothetical protein